METVDGRSPGRERKVHKIKKQLFNRFVVIFGIDFSRLLLSPQTQNDQFLTGMGGTLPFSREDLLKE